MITSTASSQVKYLIQLQSKSKLRKEKKEFVVEGLRMVQEIPEDRLIKIYSSESFCHANSDWMQAQGYSHDCIETVADSVFVQMSDTKAPQGIMAIVKMQEYIYEDMISHNEGKGQGATFLLVLENIQDPGNLGTILRVGEGAGVHGVIMSQGTVDIYNPKVIRSTMGSLFRVPFFYSNDLLSLMDRLKKDDIRLYAAHLDGKNSYTKESYAASTAFMIGNEGNGLSDLAVSKADTLTRIPMCGQVESLNAATAATILLYEAKRQRDCL